MPQKNLKQKIIEKINTIGGAIAIIFAVFTAGIGTATYVCNIFSKIEVQEIKQQHNLELLKQAREFDEKVRALCIEIDELRQENKLLQLEAKKNDEANQ